MNRRYRISKILYVILLEISLPVDVALGIGLYDYIQGLRGFSMLAILLLSGILAVTLYLLYLWQMEFLTKGKRK